MSRGADLAAFLRSRRERLQTSIGSAKSYQAGMLGKLISELRSLLRVTVIGDAMRHTISPLVARAMIR